MVNELAARQGVSGGSGAGVDVAQDSAGAAVSVRRDLTLGLPAVFALVTDRQTDAAAPVDDATEIPAGTLAQYRVTPVGSDQQSDWLTPRNRFHRNGPFFAAPLGGLTLIVQTVDDTGAPEARLYLLDQELIEGGPCESGS